MPFAIHFTTRTKRQYYDEPTEDYSHSFYDADTYAIAHKLLYIYYKDDCGKTEIYLIPLKDIESTKIIRTDN
jgi:hypothetical protein